MGILQQIGPLLRMLDMQSWRYYDPAVVHVAETALHSHGKSAVGGSTNGGTPKWLVYVMADPTNIAALGVPHGTPILGHHQM